MNHDKRMYNGISLSLIRKLLVFTTILLLMVLFASQSLVSYAAAATIVPGVQWKDTGNSILSAHGGGLFYENGTYYWIGEYKDDNHTIAAFMGHYTTEFVAHTCYRSTTLGSSPSSWTFVNNILTQQVTGDLAPGRVVERPKVIYNAATSTYVLWMHIDNNKYSDAKVGVATSTSVCGNYTYQGSFKPLGNDSRDMTVFLDTDGQGYLISGDHLNIYHMNSSFTNVDTLVASANPSKSSESPAMFKVNGTYYLLTSNKTWWNSNDNYYFTATNIAGPWTDRGLFAPSGSNTYNSQTTFVQPVTGTSGTTYLYMGDRWCENCYSQSYYVWLPLTVSGTTLTLNWFDQWTIDTATGLSGVPTGPTATPTITPTPGGSSTVMHIADIQTTDANGVAKTVYTRPSTVYYRIKIVDQSGVAVSGVAVTVNLNRPAGVWVTQTVTTGADGWGSGSANLVKASATGTYSIQVTSVSKSGATYDPSANVKSTQSFTVQ